MKKIYLVAVLVAFVSFSFAQRSTNGFVKMNKAEISTTKTPTDTLIPASCFTGSPVLYSSQGGGYVCGPNGYGDVAKAQVFVNTQSINVEGCLFWVGAKEQVGTADIVIVNLYSMDGTGTTTVGTGQPAPGTILSTISLPLDQIDTGLSMVTGLNAVTFTTPVNVTADFAIGLDFATLGDDTLGIVSTTDLDAGGTELAFEKWSPAAWHSLLEAWPLDFDMYIFAIVDMTGVNVNDNYFINGIKLSQNQPNPATNATLIRYEIQNSAVVSLEIFDITGRLVLSYDEGKQMAGKHNILVDSDKLNRGTYYYSLKADNNSLTKKMIITQ